MHRGKRRGLGLDVKTFIGKEDDAYVVFRSPTGSYHVLVEIEAKEAGRDCGGKGRNTREVWDSIWDKHD
jgi:hypothetical protein